MIPTALPRRPFFLLAYVMLACLMLSAPTATRVHAQEPKTLVPPEPKIVSIDVGFSGTYKLGCWTPITVELLGGSEACVGRVIASVPDTDGIQTRTLSDASRPVGIEPRQTTKVRMLIRVGQSMSPIKIRFVSNDGKLSAKREFEVRYSDQADELQGGIPATNRLLLEFGPTLSLNDLIQADQRTDEQLLTRVARVEQAEDLPTHWAGYEAVDTLLLSTSDAELFRPLLQNRKRIAALENWINRGGRLVLFCASSAEELLGDGGALAPFAPGKFEKMEQLTQSEPLEIFSGSGHPIGDRRVKLSTPSLVDVSGKILLSAGRKETTLPLVIRTQRGFGEIIFVGLDFDRPPLRAWPGRTSFLQHVLDWQDDDKNQQTVVEQTNVEDLSSILRASLDQKFVDVQVIPFGWVALLVGIYILLIGPGDYFFVKRFLQRMELTWITFPLVVIGVSAAAYGIANYMKGNQLLVNQVEVIDVDCTQNASQDNNATNFARGVVWTHFYTPQVNELDLSLQPSYFGQTELAENEQLVSWLGLPGYELGGMQANGSQTSVFDSGYQFGDKQASIERLPIQVWSTKTITSRWSAQVEMPIQVELQQDGAELLLGQIQNNTDIELEDCTLLYGRWAYHLGRMPAGHVQKIDDSLRPRTVKTTLTSATAGDDYVSVNSTTDDGTVNFGDVQWDMARLVKAMMFYEAINGPRYTEKQNRYQAFVDLSGVLEHDDRAILLVRNNAPGTNWQANRKPLANKKDRRWTYYRFVLNVESPTAKEKE